MTSQLATDTRETRLTRQRYDRIAPIYDALEWMMEWRARRWRRDLWSRVGTGRVLELGVGTGKNIGSPRGLVGSRRSSAGPHVARA